MARRRKYWADARRLVRCKLKTASNDQVEALRDELWDILIERKFMGYSSIESIVNAQPDRRNTRSIECALRRRMYK